jgi:hypothetical protein
MTEYDFSPEGYEKYLETQNRVSNWVTDQSGRLKQYQNPFVPSQRSTSVPPSHHTVQTTSHHSSSRPREGSHHLTTPTSLSPSKPRPSRPEHTRSFTAPVGEVQRSSRAHSRSHQSPPASSQQSRTTSPSSHVSYGHYKDPYRDSHREKPRYETYTYESTAGEIVLPPLRHGEQYRIQPGNTSRTLYIVVCLVIHSHLANH